MKDDLLSVSKIFSENLFRIPDYQRGYSWTEKQLKDFWTDIEQIEEGRNHYTGVITLEDVPKETYSRWDDDLWIIKSRHYKPYYIVDGQQRLTTIIIFIQSILELVKDEEYLNYTPIEDIRKRFIFDSKDGGISRAYIFGYEKDNPSYEFLKTKIFLEQSDFHSTLEETIYTHNLLAAKEFFYSQLKELSITEIENYYTKVTQHLLFNIYAISEDIDVCVAFETMNNRGKPLSHLELLKNRLIFLSTKFKVDVEEKSKLRYVINESWKTVYHYLGKNKDRSLDDDNFLMTHFFLRFGSELFIDDDGDYNGIWEYRHEDEYQNYLLNKRFTIKRLIHVDNDIKDILTLQEIYDYAKDIKRVVEMFYYIFNPNNSNFTDKEKISLERLRRLAQSRSSQGLSDRLILIVAIFLNEKDSDKRQQILEIIEQIEFIDAISPYMSGIESIDFTEQSIKYVNKHITLSSLISKFEKYRNDVYKKVKFDQIFSEWGKRRGYFGWKGARYFLFEYEIFLKEQSKTNREKLSWNEYVKENYRSDFNTIEHIYPQKVSYECWKAPYKDYSIPQRNILKNSIGNLVPLSRPKNSSLGNKCFSDKKVNDINKIGYIYGCYSENEIAQNEQWTAQEILLRGIKLLEFMENRWKIPLGDKHEKVKALSLEFVLEKENITL
jgi:uncharacterized protein with ParB-like and HNH nuclease domain